MPSPNLPSQIRKIYLNDKILVHDKINFAFTTSSKNSLWINSSN